MQVKPSERPPITRYVIRNADGFYYDGHGQAPTMTASGEYYEGVGVSGVPNFNTKNILFAVKYGDTESIETMVKTYKKWFIDNEQWCLDNEVKVTFDLFDTCDVLETYT